MEHLKHIEVFQYPPGQQEQTHFVMLCKMLLSVKAVQFVLTDTSEYADRTSSQKDQVYYHSRLNRRVHKGGSKVGSLGGWMYFAVPSINFPMIPT